MVHGAEKFARAFGFRRFDPVTKSRLREWKQPKQKLVKGEELPPRFASVVSYWTKMKRWIDSDTIGDTTIDREEDMAAAASTGGVPLKLLGRVGDVPSIGCGIHAHNSVGGAVLTGHGEVIIRYVLAKKACDLMERGISAKKAAEEIVAVTNNVAPKAVVVIICMDKHGRVGGARNVETTPHVFMREGMARPRPNFAPVTRRCEG